MDKILWDLFRNTGDYRYYIMLKKMENVLEDGNKKSKRNNS